jgi:hypothetical protein
MFSGYILAISHIIGRKLTGAFSFSEILFLGILFIIDMDNAIEEIVFILKT